jgi:cellulose synthase/poly-beta-1,6-N-acetylglucosamine synthase-like glycosyltransferase
MISTSLYIMWIILAVIIGYNLVLPILFFCVYKLAKVRKFTNEYKSEPDYAIIVTAYEHLNTVEQAVLSLLNLNYQNFLIYVVADKCDVSGLHFGDERVIVLRPEKELRSNTRSHLYAIERFKREHEFLTIIDSDNLTHPQYLNELNLLFYQGFLAVQGVRKAKNLNSVYACLDAAQDIYYHFYDREILFALGSSATLAGSGMAFKANYYREFLKKFDIKGAGFDKVLQIEILKQGHRIAFSKNAIVYDEKTSRADQLVKQRARWFNTWFKYAGLGLGLVGMGILRANKNQFLFGLMFLRPPLFLVLLTSFCMLVASLFVFPLLVPFWVSAFVLFIGAFVLALKYSKADRKIYKALVGVPSFMFYQLLSLLKVKRANEISVATQHFYTKGIDEVEKEIPEPLSK